jgi:hypothetical protein
MDSLSTESCEARIDFLKKIKYLYRDYISWRNTYVKYTDFRNTILDIRLPVKSYDIKKTNSSTYIYNVKIIMGELKKIYDEFILINELCLYNIRLFYLIKNSNITNKYLKSQSESNCEFIINKKKIKTHVDMDKNGSNISYKNKYIKYKNKYIQLKYHQTKQTKQKITYISSK